jgi:hypothetical protein
MVKDVFFGNLGNDHLLGINMVVRLEPQLPYIYLPKAQYENFTSYVNHKYKDIYNEPVCSYSKKACVFPESCDRVDNTILMTFSLNDK